MTAIEMTRPIRLFAMGSLELPDPAPDLSPEEAVKLLAVNFPQFAAGLLGAPERRGEALVYPVEKPPVKTNG
jgi:hypothetical protein